MKTSEQGIIINRISYSETSLILKIFTLEHGLKSFLFQGAKKKKGIVLLPLSPIEFTYYQRDDSQLAKMHDASLLYTFSEIPFHPIKSTILFFKVEILSNVMHDGVKDPQLYGFIIEELKWLDNNNDCANYPIYWLLTLSNYLGFYPMRIENRAPYFDLENGEFSESTPNTFSYKTGYEVELLHELIGKDKETIVSKKLTKDIRKKILSILLNYFELHIPNFNHVNTIDVIESIWE